MKEIQDIVTAFARHQQAGKKTALATVVHLEGSSYRRPGARMLVSEDGELIGAISGGCLEGDALRKARLAMVQGAPTLVKYDTMDDDDSQLGVGLGCNGIIHILIEPIEPEKPENPIALLQQALHNRQTAVIVTLFSLADRKGPQPGTRFLLNASGSFPSAALAENILAHLQPAAQQAYTAGTSSTITFEQEGKEFTAFLEVLPPSPHLVICGAGNDVMPLVNLAALLGWATTVVDGRANYATTARFPRASHVLVAKPEGVLSQVSVDAQTVFLLLTHNYNYDLAMLRQLLPLNLPYVGVLGPKKKMDRMLEELASESGMLTNKALAKVYGPVGLDLGAEAPEEIALSILAEIKAVLSRRPASFLREKDQPIHAPAKPALSPRMTQSAGIIILAAGASTRLGHPKQQLPFQEQTLLQRTIQTALATPARPVVVVLGANAEYILPEIEGLEITVIQNQAWAQGMGSSIRAGLSKLLEMAPDTTATFLLLCDQPFLHPNLLLEMLKLLETSGQGIVACAYQNTLGAPVLFSSPFFPNLLQLHGQDGAKKLLKQFPETVATFPFPQGGIDIDTPLDYQQLLQSQED